MPEIAEAVNRALRAFGTRSVRWGSTSRRGGPTPGSYHGDLRAMARLGPPTSEVHLHVQPCVRPRRHP